MFEAHQIESLVRILSAGGGIEISAAAHPIENLVRMASAAKGSGAELRLRGMGAHPLENLVRIASAGKGHVTFID